jgi:hypothetical protein
VEDLTLSCCQSPLLSGTGIVLTRGVLERSWTPNELRLMRNRDVGGFPKLQQHGSPIETLENMNWITLILT